MRGTNCLLCCRPIGHSPPAKRQPKKCFVQTTDWLTGTFIQDGGPTLVVSALSLLSGPEGGASFRLQSRILQAFLSSLPSSVAPPFSLHLLISSIFSVSHNLRKYFPCIFHTSSLSSTLPSKFPLLMLPFPVVFLPFPLIFPPVRLLLLHLPLLFVPFPLLTSFPLSPFLSPISLPFYHSTFIPPTPPSFPLLLPFFPLIPAYSTFPFPLLLLFSYSFFRHLYSSTLLIPPPSLFLHPPYSSTLLIPPPSRFLHPFLLLHLISLYCSFLSLYSSFLAFYSSFLSFYIPSFPSPPPSFPFQSGHFFNGFFT